MQERTDNMAEMKLPSTPPRHTIYKQDTPRSTPTDGSWSGGRDAQGRPRSYQEMREQTTMPCATTTAGEGVMDDIWHVWAAQNGQHRQQPSVDLDSLTVSPRMPEDTLPCECSIPGTIVVWNRPQEPSHDGAALNDMLSANSPKMHDITMLCVTGYLSTHHRWHAAANETSTVEETNR